MGKLFLIRSFWCKIILRDWFTTSFSLAFFVKWLSRQTLHEISLMNIFQINRCVFLIMYNNERICACFGRFIALINITGAIAPHIREG